MLPMVCFVINVILMNLKRGCLESRVRVSSPAPFFDTLPLASSLGVCPFLVKCYCFFRGKRGRKGDFSKTRFLFHHKLDWPHEPPPLALEHVVALLHFLGS